MISLKVKGRIYIGFISMECLKKYRYNMNIRTMSKYNKQNDCIPVAGHYLDSQAWISIIDIENTHITVSLPPFLTSNLHH